MKLCLYFIFAIFRKINLTKKFSGFFFFFLRKKVIKNLKISFFRIFWRNKNGKKFVKLFFTFMVKSENFILTVRNCEKDSKKSRLSFLDTFHDLWALGLVLKIVLENVANCKVSDKVEIFF